MNAAVSLHNPSQDLFDETLVNDIENRYCFSYVDHDMAQCEMRVSDDGICFFRRCPGHLLELHLDTDSYALISTEEGKIKIDVKVVDFKKYSDILVMRYLIDDEERTITIKYYEEN
ncbi:MAG: hypothetical protein IJI92_07520 [Erysipelotrichaceae bacterium]|nr:hypothetical protein [Erysipelotrichaceae bacterium]